MFVFANVTRHCCFQHGKEEPSISEAQAITEKEQQDSGGVTQKYNPAPYVRTSAYLLAHFVDMPWICVSVPLPIKGEALYDLSISQLFSFEIIVLYGTE